ncbi:MAG: hypothetical protein RBT41_08335 [Clostridia bacterium]|jgi:putative transport protein|nr:hypothetical protein [Clostridia bacterium]
MSFAYQAWLLNPFALMSLAIVTGWFLGKIRIGRFELGISGIMFTGMFIGWAVLQYAQGIPDGSPVFNTARSLIAADIIDKIYLDLFIILFIASVGLSSAKDIGAVMKKYGLKFIILGFVITAVGAGGTYAAALINKDINPYEAAGVYVGALTSSPGLGAALETAKEEARLKIGKYEKMAGDEQDRVLRVLDPSGALRAENTPVLNEEQKNQFVKNAEAGVGTGYAVGYPFGVLIVILPMYLLPVIFRINTQAEKKAYSLEIARAGSAKENGLLPENAFDLAAFAVVCVFGYTVGMIDVDLSALGLGHFSLGATGGVLIGALVLGHIGRLGPLNFRMEEKILGSIRDIAVGFFLAAVGLRYGHHAFDAVLKSGLNLALTAIVVGLAAVLAGFILGRFIFKINWLVLSGAICGGMTSTPGLGAAVDATGSDGPAGGYGATYPFALLGMVIFTIILNKLPML